MGVTSATRRALRPLLYSSFGTLEQYRLLRLHLQAWKHRRATPLVVYQMGKVGSSSVLGGLRSQGRLPLLYHVHSLSTERIVGERRTYKRHFSERKGIGAHVLHAQLIRRILAGWPPSFRRWNVVTLVRDPVARNLSTFFQVLDLHHRETGLAARIRAGGDPRLLEDLQAAFLERLDHRWPIRWFDEEILRIFGIDVLSPGFDPARGYRIQRRNGVNVLLLRLEDLERCAETALRELLALDRFTLPRANVGDTKYYGAVYRELKRRLVLPPDLLDDLYGSRMVRALYSDAEIASFRARWGSTR